MTAGNERSTGPWSGLGLAQALAFLLFAGSAIWTWRELELLLPNDRILAALSPGEILGSTLGLQLAAFAGATLLSHAAFGLLIYGLARLTEAALAGRWTARRNGLITGWFVVIAGLVLAANATLHPASIFAAEHSGLRNRTFGIYPVQLAAIVIGLVVIGCAVVAVRRADSRRRSIVLAVAVASGFALAAGAGIPRLWDTQAVAVDRPHVVIIGIDSLRNDLSLPRLGPAVVPHVEAFLAGARSFSDATSPLARTFGSWVSILTGRHPVTTGARVNLMPRGLVHEGETLAAALATQGYRTIYATDEARFANIDESYGFGQLITPPIGAIDPILSYAGDLPLVNLFASTPAGGWLFPSSHANRAASVVYRPGDFIRRLEKEIDIKGPSLISIHLTLAHWPYSWAGMPSPSTPAEYRAAYARAIENVDRQFEDVMRTLSKKGVLENAIVVVLSDHGEALGAETDSMLRETGTPREIWHSLWGHGTSVMSPQQYGVLLAIRPYGVAKFPGAPGRYDWPVSLEDVRPTLEHFVTGRPPANVDGISLLPYLEVPGRARELDRRVRFTETDFNTRSTLAGRYEPSGIIDEAALYYELDPASGWIQFREAELPALLAQKQRAALTSNLQLAAIPGPPGQAPRYLLTDRHKPSPRALEGPPDPSAEPEARRLWDALQARFPGELPAGSDEPRM